MYIFLVCWKLCKKKKHSLFWMECGLWLVVFFPACSVLIGCDVGRPVSKHWHCDWRAWRRRLDPCPVGHGQYELVPYGQGRKVRPETCRCFCGRRHWRQRRRDGSVFRYDLLTVSSPSWSSTHCEKCHPLTRHGQYMSVLSAAVHTSTVSRGLSTRVSAKYSPVAHATNDSLTQSTMQHCTWPYAIHVSFTRKPVA